MRAEQLRLDRHEVPVAGREVDEALEIEVVLDPERDGHRPHPDAGHRGIADVDEIDTGVAQEAGGLDRPVDADRARRVDLDRNDVAPGAELGQQLGGRRPLAVRGSAAASARRSTASRRAVRSRCADRMRSASRTMASRVEPRIAADVFRRRPAAAPTISDAPAAVHLRDDRGEVLGTGRVHELALDRAGAARHSEDRAGGSHPGRLADLLERLEAGLRPGAAVDPDDVDRRRLEDPARRPRATSRRLARAPRRTSAGRRSGDPRMPSAPRRSRGGGGAGRRRSRS